MNSRILAAIVLLLSVCSFGAKYYIPTDFAEPKKIDGCYQISNRSELYGFAHIVNGTYADGRKPEISACGKLTADIEFNDTADSLATWISIKEFSGLFDGQGHTIEGFRLREKATDNVGFINKSVGGTKDKPVVIQNVVILDAYFQGHKNVGLVAINEGYLLVENLFFDDCMFTADSISGGVVGLNETGASLQILATDGGFRSVWGDTISGGIIGYNAKNATAQVINSETRSASGGHYALGGFLGLNEGSFTLINSFADSYREKTEDKDKGAFVGLNMGSYDVENSFYCGNWPESKGTFVDELELKKGAATVQLHNYSKNGISGKIWGQDSLRAIPFLNDPYGSYSFDVGLYSFVDTLSEIKSYTYGKKVTLPVLSKIGFGFEGWYTNEKFEGKPVTEISDTDAGSKKFYAKWEGVPVKPAKGDDGCYQISNRGELFGFSEMFMHWSNLYEEGIVIECAKLTADIEVNPYIPQLDSGEVKDSLRLWEPIRGFEGVLDGQYHTISGLYMMSGFFDEIQGGSTEKPVVIKNIGIVNSMNYDYYGSNIYGDNGGFVEINSGVLEFERVFSGINFVNPSSFQVGSMVGRNKGNLTIRECANEGKMYASHSSDVGGLVGENFGDLHIVNSYNVSDIEGRYEIGGLVGISTNPLVIENSFNYGSVSGELRASPIVGSKYEPVVKFDAVYFSNGSEEFEGAVKVSSKDFADGTVFKALQEHPDYGGVWKQEVGVDAYPVLDWMSGIELHPVKKDTLDKDTTDKPDPENPVAVSVASRGFAGKIYAEGLSLHIEGLAIGKTVAVFDIQGRVVARPRAYQEGMTLNLPNVGTYIVRAGETTHRITVK